LNAIIEFKNVTVSADSKDILSDITFSVPVGGKVALTGKSGAGKSSILHALLGLLEPSSGEIFFDGTRVEPSSIDQVRSSVAYIGQEPVLGSASTVREALMLPFTFRANRDKRPDDPAVMRNLELLDLPGDILDSDVDVISGGEKQRIAICRGLLQEKEIFLLDEVTSALDKESAEAVKTLLTRDRFTYLSVSHHDEWIEGCDTIIEMENGRITAYGNN